MKKLFKYLFIVILALFSLGQLQRIQLTEVAFLYVHDVFVVIWLTLVMIKYQRQLLGLIKKYFFNYPTAALVIWVTIGLIVNYIGHGLSIIPLLYIVRAVVYLFFALSLPLTLSLTTKSHRCYWIMTGLIMALSGLMQYWLLPDTRFISYLGWDDHYYRLIGTLLDPNFTGIILTSTFFITQGLWNKQHWLKTTILLVLAGAILLTYSRASFLSFIIGSLLLIFIGFIKSRQNNIGLFIIMGLFIAFIPFLPRPAGEGVKLERTASVSSRIESNQLSLAKIKNIEWLVGQGLFVYREQSPAQSFWPNTAHFPDNLFVFLLTSTGVVGLTLALIIIFKVSRYLYQNDIYILTAFIGILIHAQFNHTLFQPFVWLWITTQILMIEQTKT